MESLDDLNILELIGVATSLGFAGGLIGYIAAAIVELTSGDVDHEAWVLHGTMLGGLASMAFFGFDRLALD